MNVDKLHRSMDFTMKCVESMGIQTFGNIVVQFLINCLLLPLSISRCLEFMEAFHLKLILLIKLENLIDLLNLLLRELLLI